jgi:hypothetical protein
MIISDERSRRIEEEEEVKVRVRFDVTATHKEEF